MMKITNLEILDFKLKNDILMEIYVNYIYAQKNSSKDFSLQIKTLESAITNNTLKDINTLEVPEIVIPYLGNQKRYPNTHDLLCGYPISSNGKFIKPGVRVVAYFTKNMKEAKVENITKSSIYLENIEVPIPKKANYRIYVL